MIRVSYNLSPVLRDSLNKIESLRQKILLAPLPPRDELRLRWETMIDRLYWSLASEKNLLKRNEIVKLVSTQSKRRFNEEEQQALKYKAGLDYIAQIWVASSEEITPETVIHLHRISCRGEIKVEEDKIQAILDYIQARPENPIIQAAIIFIEFKNLQAFSQDNDRISQLLAYLVLYRMGYDFRKLLVLEEYWRKDMVSLDEVIQATEVTESFTLWLAYFAKAVITQLEKVAQNLSSPDFKLDYLPSSFWELNKRQKEILTQLDEPNKTITNMDVQKTFRVSTITASRDLAKLASLGLLFSHGKGRSVKYSKV